VTELAIAARQANTWACYDCGKCTATCPISRAGASYSPRRHVLAANLDQKQAILSNGTLFSCLTCSLCDSRCPAEVGYTSLVQGLREIAHQEGVEPDCPHGGALQSVMRMMARGETRQDRLGWLEDDLQIEPEKGEVFFWTGCTVYFDALFSDMDLHTLEGTKAGIRILNAMGVKPVVSADEACCGHDLLWNGDRASFDQLARRNVKLVAASGAKTLVAPCAECLRTWSIDYEPFFEGKPPRILHLTEFIAENEDRLPKRSSEAVSRKVTYQDPCRLGRHKGVYDAPREALASAGAEVVEMRRSRRGATCCAGGTWSNCDRFAKKIQVERLREARATHADVLATACPKCQIHFRCAMKDPNLGGDLEIEMKDIAELIVERFIPAGKEG